MFGEWEGDSHSVHSFSTAEFYKKSARVRNFSAKYREKFDDKRIFGAKEK